MLNFAPCKEKELEMTPAEYVQLKAFARVDGASLALLWIVSFACYVVGITNSLYSMVAMLLMVATPFFAGRRLRRFRDDNRAGVISFMRGWAFVILMFFYAAILLAIAQYVYFAFIDQGYLMASFSEILSSQEGKALIEQYGLQQAVGESMQSMAEMRPIDYALKVLTVNISFGILLGLPIAALMQRGDKVQTNGE